jgi:multidrug efflux pump subunit AcrB
MNRLIAWFVRNSVAANLLMLVMVVGGLLSIPRVKKEFFPNVSLDMIRITVPFRGDDPERVEQAIVVKIEEEIRDLEGIKRITSVASENVGSVVVEVMAGYDTREVMNDIKARVDGISTFPEQAEQPIIEEMKAESMVIAVAVSGAMDEWTLKRLADRTREEIAQLPGITQVRLKKVRPYEISIEVSEDALRRHNLTFDEVVQAVRREAVDLPAGAIKTDAGEILLRTRGQAYTGQEFEELMLRSHGDGTRLRVRDVARVVDGFEDIETFARFDGEPAALIEVYRVGDQSILTIAEQVRTYVAEAQERLPEGVRLTPWQDTSIFYQGRADLMVRNGFYGLVLVFLVLALFLRLKLSFWVAVAIPVSFLGALWLMPGLDASLNMISMFAFIVVLGIVVDDAIVVGESVYSRTQKGESGVQAAIRGTQEVATPVIFSVLTTVAAFAPMLFLPGVMGKFFKVIPLVVIPTLLFSLVESQLVLPAHLRNLRPRRGGGWHVWARVQDGVGRGLEWWIDRVYRPSLNLGLRLRYLTLAVFFGSLILTIGAVQAGYLKFVFFPNIESDVVEASLTMPLGTPVQRTGDAVRRMETAVLALRDELREQDGTDSIKYMLASVDSANSAKITIELAPSEERNLSSREIVALWRDRVGSIPDALEIKYRDSVGHAGDPINIQLSGEDTGQMKRAAEEVREHLATYVGVYGITDSYRAGKQEITLDIKPEAQAAGLTLVDLARQVRQGFYGEQVQRIQRGRDDVRVMVRYPEEFRRSLSDLQQMRVRTQGGDAIAFHTVAELSYGQSLPNITRTDRQRTVNITADVDTDAGNAGDVLAAVRADFLPQLLERYPGMSYSLEGERREQDETISALIYGSAMAGFVIYALMAIPFRSYIQPVIVMLAIPFGMMGAFWAHLVLGMDLSMMSMLGMLALAGVVVNASIVLVDFINRRRSEGMSIEEAILSAGPARFRAILLTSLTTFAGLTPMLLERSMQAQFLIPMAVSLAFGVLFSAFVSLMMVPACYAALGDLHRLADRVMGRRPVEVAEAQEAEPEAGPAVAAIAPAAREEREPAAVG